MIHDRIMPSFTIEPQGPFSLERAADCIASFPPLRHQPGRGGDGVVRLSFLLDQDFVPVKVALKELPGGSIHAEYTGTKNDERVRRQVARIFSLDHDGREYPLVGERDKRVGALMRRFEGLRPVCFTSPYECAAWAVISQRITTAQAARIYGSIVEDGAFPHPDRLLALKTLPGLAAVKLERLHGIARAALDGALDAGALRIMGDHEAPRFLAKLPGIGPFWSNGIYLRACGIADVFPDEPIAMSALAALHGRPADAATVARLAFPLRPFRMWVCFLLRVAFARGMIERRAKVVSRPSVLDRRSSASHRSPR